MSKSSEEATQYANNNLTKDDEVGYRQQLEAMGELFLIDHEPKQEEDRL